jgi:hypothetical protein
VKPRLFWKDIRNKELLPADYNGYVLWKFFGMGSASAWGRIIKGGAAGGEYYEILRGLDKYGQVFLTELGEKNRARDNGLEYEFDETGKNGRIKRPVYLSKRKWADYCNRLKNNQSVREP